MILFFYLYYFFRRDSVMYIVVPVCFKGCASYQMNKSVCMQSSCGTHVSVTIPSHISFPLFTLSITFSVRNFNDV